MLHDIIFIIKFKGQNTIAELKLLQLKLYFVENSELTEENRFLQVWRVKKQSYGNERKTEKNEEQTT